MTDPITPARLRETLDRALADYIPGIDRAVHFVSIEQVDMLAEFYLHNRTMPVAERQKPQAVRVKPLVFHDEDANGVLTARTAYELYRVIPQNGGGFMAPKIASDRFTTAEAAMTACNQYHEARILAALDVSETPVSDQQQDLLLTTERQAIRDKAMDDAAMCCEAEADKCDDAVKWGGAPKYIANCKAASYAMRDRAYAIREMKGKPE